MDNELINILEKAIKNKERVILYSTSNFRYECQIQKIFGDWVQFLDLVKGYSKVMRISDVKEIVLK